MDEDVGGNCSFSEMHANSSRPVWHSAALLQIPWVGELQNEVLPQERPGRALLQGLHIGRPEATFLGCLERMEMSVSQMVVGGGIWTDQQSRELELTGQVGVWGGLGHGNGEGTQKRASRATFPASASSGQDAGRQEGMMSQALCCGTQHLSPSE